MPGREATLATVREFIESADVHYEVEDVVERDPFVVAFVRSSGDLDGRRMEWQLCQVLRFEGDRVGEVWSLRGDAPVPASPQPA
jgi:hypothetical protein